MENFDYVIWKTNQFNNTILQNIVAKFNDLELAKDFVMYQETIGNSFAITKNGKIMELDKL